MFFGGPDWQKFRADLLNVFCIKGIGDDLHCMPPRAHFSRNSQQRKHIADTPHGNHHEPHSLSLRKSTWIKPEFSLDQIVVVCIGRYDSENKIHRLK
jgi:hypothetical protein